MISIETDEMNPGVVKFVVYRDNGGSGFTKITEIPVTAEDALRLNRAIQDATMFRSIRDVTKIAGKMHHQTSSPPIFECPSPEPTSDDKIDRLFCREHQFNRDEALCRIRKDLNREIERAYRYRMRMTLYRELIEMGRRNELHYLPNNLTSSDLLARCRTCGFERGLHFERTSKTARKLGETRFRWWFNKPSRCQLDRVRCKRFVP